MLGYTVTKNNIVVTLGGKVTAVPRDAVNAGSLLDALARNDECAVGTALDLALSMRLYSDGEIEINKDESVLWKGELLPKALANKVYALFKDQIPYGYLIRFFEKLERNPSMASREQLYKFLEHTGLCLTPKGDVLGYKGVNPDYWSVTGNLCTRVLRGRTDGEGRIYNGIGEVVEVARYCVMDNPDVACGPGLHAANLSYARGWAAKVVIVKFDPADAVSVPNDHNHQKLRVCKYEVVCDYRGELRNSAATSDDPYAEVVTRIWEDPIVDEDDPDIEDSE